VTEGTENRALWPFVMAFCVVAAVAGCSQPPTPVSPTASQVPASGPAPTPQPGHEPPPGPAVAVLVIKTATVEGTANGFVVAMSLVEEGGVSSATVTSTTFNLADGPPWTTPMSCAYCGAVRVEAGSQATILPEADAYGDHAWSLSVPGDYRGRLAVTVSYRDEEGRPGTVSALVALPWLS
jgi:hypothetical protein